MPVSLFIGVSSTYFSLGFCQVRCVTVLTDCAGDPLVAHSLDALKRTKRSKTGTKSFSLTPGKPAAVGNGGMKSSAVLKLCLS